MQTAIHMATRISEVLTNILILSIFM